MSQIGLELGADVPFFIFGVPALVQGIGEKVEPLALNLDGYEILLLFPPECCSTPLMYKAYRDLHPDIENAESEFDSTRVMEIFEVHAQTNPLAMLVDNDFEEVIDKDFPVIAGLLRHLRSDGQACASLSGSGSTIFVLQSGEKAISLDFENYVSRIAKQHSAGLRKARILSKQ
ncbi:MAG: hypothetical protein GYA55_00005 [SAR324 cluster bacterium]|uniref:GHMP kinase C-terminal domain-containing protein n=1 Tax=SAR324 cluster bacterium TaxID=2024889 RepID=A0A7X9IIX6_9DELT|nr:hypothetical protein [SAR324 cluster bacterium]